VSAPLRRVSYSTKWCVLFLRVATSCMLNATHLQEQIFEEKFMLHHFCLLVLYIKKISYPNKTKETILY
jgi:hypothetical protein